jgi:hypothetical protein
VTLTLIAVVADNRADDGEGVVVKQHFARFVYIAL